MPILLNPLQDPTDLVIAGEQMRASVPDANAANQSAVASVSPTSGFWSRVGDEDVYAPMNSFIDGNRLSMRRSKSGELQMRSGAGISTTCGAWLSLDYTPLINPLLWAANVFTITGQTVTGAGAPLGNARVVVFETGRITIADVGATVPVVAETVSDGSGNFSITVPLNTAYQVSAYLAGSPDRAGISRNDVVPPGPLTIYMRDPTAADGAGSAVFRAIGSPVVRRISL